MESKKALLAACRFQVPYTPGTNMQNAGTQKYRGGETRAVSMAVWYNTVMKMMKETTSTTETVTISRAEYEELKAQNRWLLEQLRVVRSKQFGPSSEKASEEVQEQLSFLFNEAEVYADEETAPEKTTVEVRSHTRQKKSGSARDILPENTEVVEVEHILPENDRLCPQCGEAMQPIGTEVQETLQIIPPKVILHRDIYYTYGCGNCKTNGITTPIRKTPK